MIKQIVHVNLVVSDVERSLTFYRDLLGAEVVRDWWGESDSGPILGLPGTVKWHTYMLRWGPGDEVTFPQLDLLQWIDPPSYGTPYPQMNHVGIPRIALEVTDVHEAYEHLRANGAEFLSPPLPTNPTTRRGKLTFACCVKDPDGIVVELIGPLGAKRMTSINEFDGDGRISPHIAGIP